MNINEFFPKKAPKKEFTIEDEVQKDFIKFCHPPPVKQPIKVIAENLKFGNELESNYSNEFSDYNKKHTVETVIKEMYNQDPDIFDKDFDIVHETAVYINNVLNKEVYTESEVKVFISEFITEDGRIVKNVNTTDDVGLDEIKIQARKMGFSVTSGGVPAYLTPDGAHPNPVVVESKLNELHMGPKRLNKEVQQLMKIVTPIVGMEFEVCKRRGEDERDMEITPETSIDDLTSFFTDNYEEEFDKLRIPWFKWVKRNGDYGDEGLEFGRFLNANDYYSASSLFSDNQDWLEWPELGDDDGFNLRDAKATADDMESDYGMTAYAHDTYHGAGRPEDTWVIEPDSSIRPEPGDVGMEIISPPQDYEDAMISLDEILSMFRDTDLYYTNESTGLHINVSIEGIGFSGMDFVKLVLLAGDSVVLQQFDRELNNYTNHAMSALSDFLRPGSDKTDMVNQSKAGKLVKLLDTMRKGMSDNIESAIGGFELGQISIKMKNNYIEFRSAGGDYMYNYEGLVNTVNRFIVAYVAASDPDMYKKEYAKKLYKLVSTHGPQTSSRLNQHVMQIFAMYNSGNIDKNRLKELLSHANVSRQEIKTGGKVEQAINKLHQAIPDLQFETLAAEFKKGLEIEKKISIEQNRNLKAVYNNLNNDINFYADMDRWDVKSYIEGNT